jgi:hypothetical protein
MNARYTNRQGIQEINAKRWKTWVDSPVEHTKEFKPYDVEQYGGPGPLKGRTIAWAEANGTPGWQSDERIVAIDGYRMKRLPNKHILAQYIATEAVKPPNERTPLKDFAREARRERYKAKHNGEEMPPTPIAVVGKIVGQYYQQLMEKYGDVVQYTKQGRDGKTKRGFHIVRKDNQQPFPKGLFAKINADMYNRLVEQVFEQVFHGQPLDPTKENKAAFSQAVVANAPQAITAHMVEDTLLEMVPGLRGA